MQSALVDAEKAGEQAVVREIDGNNRASIFRTGALERCVERHDSLLHHPLLLIQLAPRWIHFSLQVMHNQDSKVSPLCLFRFKNQGDNACDSNNPSFNKSYTASTKSIPNQNTASQKGQIKRSVARLAALKRRKTYEISSSDDADGMIIEKKNDHTSRMGKIPTKHISRKQRRKINVNCASHLTSYLLTSVKTAGTCEDDLPSLGDVLATIKDAWPNSKELKLKRPPEKGCPSSSKVPPKNMPVPPTTDNCTPPALIRRRSVPEEIIRRFNVSKDKTSGSETNATMPEATPPSSKETEEKSSRTIGLEEVPHKPRSPRRLTMKSNRSFHVLSNENSPRSAEEGSSDSDSDAPGMQRFKTLKRAPLRRDTVIEVPTVTYDNKSDNVMRVSQQDYYNNGRGVLRINAIEKSSQTGDYPFPEKEDSWTTVSGEEDTDTGNASESISSPQLCTRALTSSENVSSDSDHVKCTCAELTSSKETSTDPNHSGKSTLSQSVSEKTDSTQDSTMSIKSVSTRGSSISMVSNSSSPDIDLKTSAKETTTSPDNTPRNPQQRRRYNGDNSKDSFGRGDNGGSRNNFCPVHRRNNVSGRQRSNFKSLEATMNAPLPQVMLTDVFNKETAERKLAHSENDDTRTYEWIKWTEEEQYVIQKQRYNKFVDNGRQFIYPTNKRHPQSEGTVSVCTSTGTSYQSVDNIECTPVSVPRYSALPRTLSMVVNTPSIDINQYSDSDCNSLSDSLEEGQNERKPTYYDTKEERKPVRGDIMGALENKRVSRSVEPKGRAYFVSINEQGDEGLVTNIHKIPEPPNVIKEKIYQRHLNICKTQKAITKANEMPVKLQKKKRVLRKKHANTDSKIRITRKRQLDRKELSKEVLCSISENIANTEVNEERARDDGHNMAQATILCEKKAVEGSNKNENNTNEQSQSTIESSNVEELMALMKPRAIIHPSQSTEVSPIKSDSLDALQKYRLSLITSLESTATVLRAQQPVLPTKQDLRLTSTGKRQSKFHQRFEVIPEERSSSLTSSADERRSDKERRYSLPVKLLDSTTSPAVLADSEGKSFRRYSLGSLSNFLISKLMGRHLEAIPCVQKGPNNEDQHIVIFSPKDAVNQNSSKGRDALLAMNREDFERLSKGWMNFYLLKEGSDHDSANEENEEVVISKGIDSESTALVCKLPSMEKQTTTSESSTDETSTYPGHCNGNTTFAPPLENKINPVPTSGVSSNPVNSEKEMTVKENATMNENAKYISNAYVDSVAQLEEKSSLLDRRKTTKEASTYTENRRRLRKQQNIEAKLSENIKLGSSNTVLKTTQLISVPARKMAVPDNNRGLSLPEIPAVQLKSSPQRKSKSLVESLPRIPITSGSEDIDSDSTVYMRAPVPQIPRLALEDCCDCMSDDYSSSSPRQKCAPQRRKVAPVRNRTAGNGWSVTVAGTVAFPRSTPDVQMRLSFPVGSSPPIVSQSDSGFAEDGQSRSITTKKQKHEWTVTVQNPHNGNVKGKCTSTNHTRTANVESSTRKKSDGPGNQVLTKGLIEEKFAAIWPKVQDVIENEFNKSSFREEIVDETERGPPLSIRGTAVLMDTKPRAPKMSERDITRNTTARSMSIDSDTRPTKPRIS